MARGLDFLLVTQQCDGDLRGPAELRGGNSGSANMCDHAIAVLALAEAATMTQDPRYVDSVMRGAQFIVAEQPPQAVEHQRRPGHAPQRQFHWYPFCFSSLFAALGYSSHASRIASQDDAVMRASGHVHLRLAVPQGGG